MLKKVIISAKGFAVAQTTNKSRASWTMCTTEKAEKKSEKALESERTRTEKYCAHQQDHFCESVHILSQNIKDNNAQLSTVISSSPL